MTTDKKNSELGTTLRALFPQFSQVIFFSLFTNVLSLSSTFYMLEVYDRVVNSRNHKTLLMLTILVVVAYVVLEFLEFVRAELLQRCSTRWDENIRRRLFDAIFANQSAGSPSATRAVGDWRILREFLASPLILAILDAPLASLIMLLLFAIHPVLGIFSLCIALLQVVVAVLTEKATKKPLLEAQQMAWQTQRFAEESLRNVDVLEAMGMLGNFRKRWQEMQGKALERQSRASELAAVSSAAVKFIQLFQGSAMLGLSVWLSLSGEHITGGLMMVSSVLGGRALAPFVQVITQWRQIVTAQAAFGRLEELLENVPLEKEKMPLPAPAGRITLEDVKAMPPGGKLMVIRGVSMDIPAGKVIALIGPSASGKSSLARLLVGAWQPLSGKVRFDGNDLLSWQKAELGPHIGYLPQEIELFDGSVADNIARFGEPDREKVEAAARAVGLHETIMSMPAAYDQEVGSEGEFLSGGVRQRLALARAIYGNPRVLVLDEPNSSLDPEGEKALGKVISTLKSEGVTIVLITHRTSLLNVTDGIAIMQDGAVKVFGPRDEVLAKMQAGAALQLASRRDAKAGETSL